MSKWSLNGDTYNALQIKVAKIIAEGWLNEAHKQKFIADPRAMLKIYGLIIPDNVGIEVVDGAEFYEITETGVKIPFPPKPDFDTLLETFIVNGKDEVPSLTCICFI